MEQATTFPLSLSWNRLKLKFFPTPQNLKRKDELIKKQLYKDFDFILDALPNREEKIHHHKIVWVMWQQGFDKAPSLVRLCRQTLDKFLPKNVHVVELDDTNVYQYIDVPSIIQKKYSQGIISRAHYSDIVRCLILKEYGGIWIDSTVLLTGNMDASIFDKKFWTVKQNRPVVSNFRWSTYAMGGE